MFLHDLIKTFSFTMSLVIGCVIFYDCLTCSETFKNDNKDKIEDDTKEDDTKKVENKIPPIIKNNNDDDDLL